MALDIDLLNKLMRLAKLTYPDNDVLAQLSVCQAVLESDLLGDGSVLLRDGNNLFGITGVSPAGKRLILPTIEYVKGKKKRVFRDFAKYDSIEECFKHHRKILSFTRYSLVWSATDLPEAAQLVRYGGWATDPNYSRKLVSVWVAHIKKHWTFK